jgi:hypothetical protein
MNADFELAEDRYVTTTCLAGFIGPQVISPAPPGM